MDSPALPTISPSVSNLILHLEESGVCWFEFNDWIGPDDRQDRIRLTVHRLVELRTGNFIGIGEKEKSEWLTEVIARQGQWYPRDADLYDDLRHFYVGGHDFGFEFLAERVSWEIISPKRR